MLNKKTLKHEGVNVPDGCRIKKISMIKSVCPFRTSFSDKVIAVRRIFITVPVIINYFKVLRVLKKYLFLKTLNFYPNLIVIITL
jgi:hypothetical protein